MKSQLLMQYSKLFITGMLICQSFSVISQNTVVTFSQPSGVAKSAFSLSLATADPSRTIYYTTNGSLPTLNSTQYTQPISISQTAMITAVSYKNGTPDAQPSRAGYIFLASDMSQFSSNLPVLIIENFNQGAVPKPTGGFMGGGDLVEKQFVVAALYEPVNGRTSFASVPTITTNGGLKVRGSSSATFPKLSYGFDSWNAQSEESEIKPLGMAKSADWVIFGTQNQDPTYIRSVWIYELSRQMGEWAPATRAVEVFINADGGAATSKDYLGLYFLMEKIGRGNDRLDIEKLETATTAADPAISGGYILKVDRLDPEATGFSCLHASTFSTTNYYYPKERNMPDAQKPWVRDYIATFETALKEIPQSRRYLDYFDAQAAMDHWILKAMPMDADAFVLSEFMYKDRGGVIKMGPVWDLDRSAGSVDTRTANYDSWSGGALANYMNYGWYGYLHNDPEYFMGLKDRWFQLRQAELSDANIDRIIDSLAQVMQEAMVRDVKLWPVTRFDKTFQGEITHLKTWMHNRTAWIDSQWGAAPMLYHAGSLITGNVFEVVPSYSITIQKPKNASGTLYYTTDGTDPRLAGGAINPAAKMYASAITIQNITAVKVRIYNNGIWSPLRSAQFYIEQDLSALKFTEIHYNPANSGITEGKYLEFIEIKNTGSATIFLAGVSISEGVECAFHAGATIAPGQIIVIAGNATAFEAVNGFNPDYIFTKNLSNSGERLALADYNGSIITAVEYSDAAPWPAAADGAGFSLVPISISPSGNQDAAAQWRASSLAGGSPGKDDILAVSDPIMINEVLTNAASPDTDAIELYNPNSKPVDISGWLLSNNASLTSAWAIPAGTVMPARSYLTFYQGHYTGGAMQYAANEFGTQFSLDHIGTAVYIFAAQGGKPTGYSHGMEIGSTQPGISYGLYTTSTKEVHVVPLVSKTFGAANSAPKVGPLVISQIQYNPQSAAGLPSGCEFIQIQNISAQPVKLYDERNPANTWKISGTGLTLPTGMSIAAGETMYIKNNEISDAAFRSRYQLAATVQILAFGGALDNSGESISIEQPLAPVGTAIPYTIIDKVKFNDQTPWPDANGNGKMLQRNHTSEYGNDPVNWQAADGMGKMPVSRQLSVTNGSGSGMYYEFSKATATADAAPAGKAFLTWTGTGAAYLTNAMAATGTLTMPEKNITLTAEYADIVSEQAIAAGAVWKYHNLGTDLAAEWKTPSYNDKAWASGTATLGEDDIIATRIGIGAAGSRYPTVYFRKAVTISGARTVTDALISLKYDDGAVVYINGTEAFRAGMPTGTITYSTWANISHEAAAFEDFRIDPALFHEGENIISVEVHNQNAQSSDLQFDMSLAISKVPNLATAAKQFITLSQGWNLVSLCIQPADNRIENIFPNAETVKTCDLLYRRGQARYLNTLQALRAGDAVLVYNTQTEQVQITGAAFTGTYIYPLRSGWNMVGVPHAAEKELTGLPSQCASVKDMDEFYDFSSGSGTLKRFRPGKAYFLKATSASSLFYESE